VSFKDKQEEKMARKILAITIALLMAVSLIACTNGNEEESTSGNNTINIPEESTTTTGGNSTETGTETGNGGAVIDEKPGDLTYDALEAAEDIYVLHQNGAVNLREADNSIFKSVANGTALKRIAISKDGVWSKVLYEGKEYYIVTKAVTTFADVTAGFVATTLTLTSVGSLNVRIAPEVSEIAGKVTQDNVVGTFEPGDKIKVVAYNEELGWYQVEFDCDYEGPVFIRAKAEYFVETSTTTEETTTAVEETTTAAAE
jgi:uncharacterized protein YgiM (DUF1202 family)